MQSRRGPPSGRPAAATTRAPRASPPPTPRSRPPQAARPTSAAVAGRDLLQADHVRAGAGHQLGLLDRAGSSRPATFHDRSVEATGIECMPNHEPKELRDAVRGTARFPTTTPPSSPTSTRRPCASITTSTTRPTWTRSTPRSRAPSWPTSRSRRWSTNLSQVPDDKRTAVRNNGGGHLNHSLFWEWLSPDGGGEPDGELADAIDSAFGSFSRLPGASSRTPA